jgi:hypothetical protein
VAKKKEVILHKCKECVHSTDWQNKANDGHLILCRCPFREYLQFLEKDGCNDNFKLRR